jgi:signal transduction histidine kinase
MSTIFDSLNAVVFVADLESDVLLYMNSYGATLCDGDWQGKKSSDILQFAQNVPREFCGSDLLVRDGVPQPDCLWELHNSATGRWYQCIDRAVTWTDGRLVRLEIAIDITERREMEQMKDEIISAVSHEMRTPLTAMLGFVEVLLESEVDPEERRTYLTTVYQETRRLNELISNFLDLQQLKARNLPCRFTDLEVRPLLVDAAALFTFDREHHRIEIDCPERLPPVRGDEGKLHQVLTNLISNAIKYSPPESRVVLGAESDGNEVVIRVQDEGCGIPAELRDRVFEKFYRMDNSDRRQAGGTGLGLALVRELVAAHGGRIRVESAGGVGSIFYVTLPAVSPREVQGGT